jgi:ATP-binding cassette subfamily B protein
LKARIAQTWAAFRYVPGTARLVWETAPRLALGVIFLTALAALLPAAIAYVGKLIVDGVVEAARTGSEADRERALVRVLVEFGLIVLSTGVNRGLSLLRELLRAHLSNHLNVRILEKALALEVQHFEDSSVYDKMQNARREASQRPLALVLSVVTVFQNALSLSAYALLLIKLSPWTVVILALASVPAFVAEARLASEAFRLTSWRAPEGRRLNYLEWILTRDSHVKEVKLFDLGPLVLGRYKNLFDKFFREDRQLAIRRTLWGLSLGILALLAFYGCYVLVASRAAEARLTLGDMTLYLALFRQGQSAFQDILASLSGMYENALFMSNLFDYFDIPTTREVARIQPPATVARGAPQAIEFRSVSFRYPHKEEWALRDVSFTLRPGEKLGLVGENGAGKTTLVKLLLRLYEPTEGDIFYGGVNLKDLDPHDVRSRVGAVFQDFVRYQFTLSENIGLGDVRRIEDQSRVSLAAQRAGADSVVAALPQGYDTVLGGWFETGQELSAGQWQKVAVARGFMRDAEVLILDEPTASIDAEAEHELFGRLRALAEDRTAIIISHRFSTVRAADRIAVLSHGRIVELGSHRELMDQNGRYAHLFRLQAQGYLDEDEPPPVQAASGAREELG